MNRGIMEKTNLKTRAKKWFLPLVLASLVVSLTGCTGFGKAALSDSELKAIMVSKLASDCTGLNAYMLTPDNWESVGQSPTGAGSEYVLSGDGGAIALDVIPDGAGSANVVIADLYVDVTNINLYNSGCRTLASPPVDSSNSDLGTTSDTSNQQTGHYEQQCQQVMVPNPQYDPMAGPGVMAMKGINQYFYENQCSQVWVQ